MIADVSIADEHTERIEAALQDYFVVSLTSQSAWNDKLWFFDRIVRSAGHSDNDYKIYFATIPEQYLDIVRYWVLVRMRNNSSATSCANNVTHLSRFFEFLVKECCAPELSDVNRQTIEAYEYYLRELIALSASSKESSWTAVNNLFRDMLTWPQMPDSTPVAPGNPFNRTELDRKHASRLIPDMVLDQLDEIYRDDRLPHEDRLIYWVLRSIPSRIGEVCSILLDCLRPYSHNNRQGFILTIPDFKQSANQHRPKKKLIHLLDEGHGKFLIDMIREQQKIAKCAQDALSEKSTGYLMVSPRVRRIGYLLSGRKRDKLRDEIRKPFVMKGAIVRKRMKNVVRHFSVNGPDGKPYNAISHSFRHNGITERIYEGFSYVEIRDMSGHTGNQMLTTSYVHVKDEEIKARAKKNREKGVQGPAVQFQGRIMNMSPEMEARLLKNPRAYRIGDLGMCSNVISCGNDLFECLDCDLLIPDADNEDFYTSEVKKWSARAMKHTANGNTLLTEHAIYMATLHEKQLDRIRHSLEMFEAEEPHGKERNT